MIVKKNPDPLALVEALPSLLKGHVYLHRANGDKFEKDGQCVVLERGGSEPLEVRTVTQATGSPAVGMVYLSTEDFNAFRSADGTNAVPTVRLYGFGDWSRKIVSAPGFLLLVPALLALVSAGIVFFADPEPAPSADAAVRAQQTLTSWAEAPLTELVTANADSNHVARIYQEFEHRSLQAQWCMELIQGRQAPSPEPIAGINCAEATKQEPEENWTKPVAGWLALAAAVVGGTGALYKCRFGHSPTGS